jgi:hypothetical protein
MRAAMPAILDARDQSRRIYALDRLFTGRIDRRGIDDIGIVEGGGKIIHMIAQAREAMRLNHGDHAVLHALARGGQNGADFDRVVAVIVDDGHAINLAHLGKAALDPAEFGETGADDVLRTPISTATATAASAFWTLWRPGIGNSIPSIRRKLPSRWRSTAVKRLPPG